MKGTVLDLIYMTVKKQQIMFGTKLEKRQKNILNHSQKKTKNTVMGAQLQQ